MITEHDHMSEQDHSFQVDEDLSISDIALNLGSMRHITVNRNIFETCQDDDSSSELSKSYIKPIICVKPLAQNTPSPNSPNMAKR